MWREIASGMVHLLMQACVSLYALKFCLSWCIRKRVRWGVVVEYFAYVSISVSASERHTCVMLKEKMKTAVLSLPH